MKGLYVLPPEPDVARRKGHNGGAEEDRTPDLRIANATLSQLSYRPENERALYSLIRNHRDPQVVSSPPRSSDPARAG
jgi:hypothetical protein